uniref:Uncharacterized protein n=1 Tax=Anguilla anguilla TaxID=7936 RepID=A0A0E9XDI1_ANGAN
MHRCSVKTVLKLMNYKLGNYWNVVKDTVVWNRGIPHFTNINFFCIKTTKAQLACVCCGIPVRPHMIHYGNVLTDSHSTLLTMRKQYISLHYGNVFIQHGHLAFDL